MIPLRAISSLALLTIACATTVSPPPATLRFSVAEGPVLNEFFRRGASAAHLVLTSGASPRLVIAFPAGNSGAALWFDAPSAGWSWQPDVWIDAAQQRLSGGGVLHGITAELTAVGGPVEVRQAITGSVRVIRDYENSGEPPVELDMTPQVSESAVVWRRRRLDGAPGYHLSMEVLSGAVTRDRSQAIVLAPGADGRLRLRVTALTGDAPLTPLSGDSLLAADATPDARLQRILAFLSYREKLLAGSWRFNTYFGRDTLMSLRLLAPVLQPEVVESGLGSVLERLNASGEVAHEEDIGEYAVLRRMRDGLPPAAAPWFDYRMIDDDFMLAIVAANYLLETTGGRERAAAFLAQQLNPGETRGSALVRNLRFVIEATAPFAAVPRWDRLIALKPGEYAGNWRDSETGLGRGRFPYDVNAVFVPAALTAIARLRSSGLMRPYLEPGASDRLGQAAGMAEIWLREAPRMFDVDIASSAARTEVRAYARSIGLDPAPALQAIAGDAVHFRAVSLDEHGRPVPVLHSDEALSLLLLDIAPDEAARLAATLTRAFPAGLATDVGLLVANPAYAPDALEPDFDHNRYHGTVIWSWQQAMFAAGLERQIGRDDLAAADRETLLHARSRLRASISAADTLRGSELWSWSLRDGAYRVEPFGQQRRHETESNAAQLWSTVHLARPRD